MSTSLKNVPLPVLRATQGFEIEAASEHTVVITKMVWIVDENPTIHLEFGKRTKKFIVEVAHRQGEKEERLASTKEETATSSYWKVSAKDQTENCNTILKKLIDDFMNLRKEGPTEYEVYFNSAGNVELSEWAFWKRSLLFTLVKSNEETRFLLTPSQFKFMLGSITTKKLEIPKVTISGEFDAERVYCRHESVEIGCDGIPVDYLIRMQSQHVNLHTSSVKAKDVKDFIQAWNSGRHLRHLKGFYIFFANQEEQLEYENLLEGTVNVVEGKSWRIIREDDKRATVHLGQNSFSFVVQISI